MADGAKKDEEAQFSFPELDKGALRQDTRAFNQSPLDLQLCFSIISKLLLFISRGETFSKNEGTEIFFATTRLFENKDVALRRMVYLLLKELAPMADNVIVITSSLTKDMISNIDFYRANSLRVLCKISEAANLGQQIERPLKQALVAPEPYVTSSALVSAIHLFNSPQYIDVVKRCQPEILQNATKTKSVMNQYHALGLLHQLRRHDRLSVSKLVTEMTRSTIRSQYAHCLLIRFSCDVLLHEDDPMERAKYTDYLDSCLHDKSEMVVYEAARGIASLPGVTTKELNSAVSVLEMFLASNKATLRFAAIRTLNKIAMQHPNIVSATNKQMETLITDKNRSIATFAITTLLKTGSEGTVDQLMKQITQFLSDISDEFKIVVVDAIKLLSQKYKQKYKTLLNFLSSMLRDEGGEEYKKAIVDTILYIIHEAPESCETGLGILCEFIEDCEYTFLSTKILNLLGQQGPKTSKPEKYIRYIYNRVHLENAIVRASAVCALAKFGLEIESLRPSILVLLSRSLYDLNDEVRDRATFYLAILKSRGAGGENGTEGKGNSTAAQDLVFEDLPIPLDNLLNSLTAYISAGPSANPFNLNNVSLEVVAPPQVARKKPIGGRDQASAAHASDAPKGIIEHELALFAIPEFSKLGNIYKSSTKPIELTESQTEYVVTCIKHVFAKHIIFQFNVTNTLSSRILSNVSVKMEPANNASSRALKYQCTVPSSNIGANGSGVTYVLFEVVAPNGVGVGSWSNLLRFEGRDISEEEEEGEEDEFSLEDVDVGLGDYVKRGIGNMAMTDAKWKEEFERLGSEGEMLDRFSLSAVKTLEEAVRKILDLLGLGPVAGTEKVKSKSTRHELLLCGGFLGGVEVFARVRMRRDEGQGVMMEFVVRSEDKKISQMFASVFEN
eukprot:TRINITY_DN4993_c0_g3_i1.p1 TRINITY_DN4993_c0_g3~~TRINITY_DN4993_c0_g3_i1.p1  ORF type:complete len:901 (-),score=243.42 TRINITY_DN4993_c0_g3_i1:53-2755(-)